MFARRSSTFLNFILILLNSFLPKILPQLVWFHKKRVGTQKHFLLYVSSWSRFIASIYSIGCQHSACQTGKHLNPNITKKKLPLSFIDMIATVNVLSCFVYSVICEHNLFMWFAVLFLVSMFLCLTLHWQQYLSHTWFLLIFYIVPCLGIIRSIILQHLLALSHPHIQEKL